MPYLDEQETVNQYNWGCFFGKKDLALEKLKQNTRRFAKRQLTWFRNRMTVKFYQISSPEYPKNVVQDLELFLNEREGEKVGQS